MISDFWYKNNCSVLYVEQRGQNNSSGEYMGFGLTERFDCLDWLNWEIERCGSDIPVYLAGVSMGATKRTWDHGGLRFYIGQCDMGAYC